MSTGELANQEVDVAVIAEVLLRGITQEQYDAVRARAGWTQELPEGGLAHLTWWDGGDCRNADAWESEAAFAAFGEQRLGPALAALGLEVQPEVTFHPAHEVLTARRGVIAVTAAPEGADAVALTRGGYERFAAGDIPGVLALMDETIVWSTPASLGFGGVYHGPSGAGEFFTKLPQNFAELRVEPRTYHDAGDSVVVEGTHRGRTTAGEAFEVPFVHIWTWRAGKATAFTEVMDSLIVGLALGEAVAAERRALGTSGSAMSTAGIPRQRGNVMTDAETTLRRMFDEIIN